MSDELLLAFLAFSVAWAVLFWAFAAALGRKYSRRCPNCGRWCGVRCEVGDDRRPWWECRHCQTGWFEEQ